MMTIEDIQKQRRKLILNEIIEKSKNKRYIAIFNGIPFYINMNLSIFSQQELILYHSFLHTLYCQRNPSLPKDHIRSLHSKIIIKLKTHNKFDSLDE